MLTFLVILAALFFGGILGWKITAKNERMRGYAEAVDDQFKRLRELNSPRPLRMSAAAHHLRVVKGDKK